MHMPDQGGGKVDHALGNAAVGEEVTGEDKEGDRHDLELLNPGKELEGHRLDRHGGHGKEKGQNRQAERDGDRHTGKHENGEEAEDNQCGHLLPPCSPSG